MKYLYNKDISLIKSTSIFLLCIYYFYVFFGVLMRKDLIKYFSKRDNIKFFMNFTIKFINVLLSIIYIRYFHNFKYGNVIYIIQILLIVSDLILEVKIIKRLKELNNTDLSKIESYEFEIEEIICNKTKYEEILLCVGYVLLIALVNFNYSITNSIERPKKVAIIIFIINFILIILAKFCFDKRLSYFNKSIIKFYKRSVAYSKLTNIICFTSSIFILNIEICFWITTIWIISNFIYCFKKIFLPISKIANGMNKYLEK